MSTLTPHIGLTKPVGTEFFDIALFNTNYDILDAEINALKTTVAPPPTNTTTAPTVGHFLYTAQSPTPTVGAATSIKFNAKSTDSKTNDPNNIFTLGAASGITVSTAGYYDISYDVRASSASSSFAPYLSIGSELIYGSDGGPNDAMGSAAFAIYMAANTTFNLSIYSYTSSNYSGHLRIVKRNG